MGLIGSWFAVMMEKEVMNTIEKNTEAPLDGCKKFDLELDTEKVY
jgi:hypothetical protein